MSSELKLRRGSTAAHSTFTGADGEVTLDTDKNVVVSHDGITLGGFPHTKAVDLAASSGASLVGFQQAGGVARTVESKLHEIPTIDDFRQVGDPDDTLAITRALATEKPFLAVSGKTYSHEPIFHIGNAIIGTTGEGVATFECSNATPGNHLLFVSGSAKTGTTLSADAPANALKITVASAENINVGDLLRIVSPNLWPNDNRGSLYFGQLAKVTGKSELLITLESTIVNGMPSGSEVVPITPIRPQIKNIIFRRPKTTGSVRGVNVSYADGGYIDDCGFENLSRIGLSLTECYKTEVNRPRVVGSNLAVSETLGYGVGFGGCFGVKVDSGTMHECRRGVDLGGSSIPSIYCEVTNNTVQGGGIAEDGVSEFWPSGSVQCDGVGSHGGAEGTIYLGNKLLNVRAGTIIRGRKEVVKGNTYAGDMEIPVEVVHGADIQIIENEYKDQAQYRLGDMTASGGVVDAASTDARPERMVYVNVNNYDLASGLAIERNKAANLRDCFVYFDGNSGKTINGLVVKDNWARIQMAVAGTVSLLKANSNKYVPGLVMAGNDIEFPADHEYVKFKSVNIVSSTSSVNRFGEGLYHVVLLDDAAVKISTGHPTSQKIVRIISSANSISPRLNKLLRNNSVTDWDFGGSTGMTTAATALTGTTGEDGTWSVSHADGAVYIENRAGSTGALLVEIVG